MDQDNLLACAYTYMYVCLHACMHACTDVLQIQAKVLFTCDVYTDSCE